jgi:flagellin
MLNSINTNIAAFNAQSNIAKANAESANSISRLSSGERIAKASDDVSGLSVGTSLRTAVTSLRAALGNTTQGISLLQVADGALAETQDMLQRMKSISVQASSGSLTDTERGFLDQEFQNLMQEIDRLVDGTNFNDVKLINGGLGQASALMVTGVTNFDPTSASLHGTAPTAVAATSSIEAFNDNTGATTEASGAAGQITFLDDADAAITGADTYFNTVNAGVFGKIESIEITDVSLGVGATMNVTINGIEFTGAFAHNAAAGNVIVRNGDTNIQLFTARNVLDETALAQSRAQVVDDYKDITIQRVQAISGVDFSGTALAGGVGQAANGGNAVIRTDEPGNIDISNFKYVSNTGAANTNILSVEVNGETWTSTGVNDLVAAGSIAFEGSGGESLIVDVTGIDANITNIRTSATDRANFINALNVGFSRAGGGVTFNVGSTSADTIDVQLGSAKTSTLFNGQTLNVNTIADAQAASDALDVAIDQVTALRANVGALQSRFEFAAANVESSLQNQDAARGVLLDTDIARESTAFATSQVQLQAGVATLAQANLLQQTLLKLIG